MTMSDQGPTCLSQEHPQHMCQLKLQGLDEEVKRLSDTPTFECTICMTKANCPENLCDPSPLLKEP